VKICTGKTRVLTGIVGDGDDGEWGRMGMGISADVDKFDGDGWGWGQIPVPVRLSNSQFAICVMFVC